MLRLIGNNRHVFGLFLDISKAYDRIQYDILLDKLSGLGVRGTVYKWFATYLKISFFGLELPTLNCNFLILKTDNGN